jgi:hypothetical protein
VSQVLQTVQRFNYSGLTSDLSEAIGVTAGIVAGAYLVYKMPSQSQGAFVDLILGVIIMLIFPNFGVINGIGVGLVGYGLYQLIKLASNGAIV